MAVPGDARQHDTESRTVDTTASSESTSRPFDTQRLSIGELGQQTGLSHKAIRLYDKSGLLRPREVDPCTGYRYYGCLLYTSPSPRD